MKLKLSYLKIFFLIHLVVICAPQIIFSQKITSSNYKLTFSTFLGGSEYTEAKSVAIDSSGNIYIVGRTRSKDFPIVGNAIEKEFKGEESFIKKFDNNEKLVYSSYIGIGNCLTDKIAVDFEENVYVAGTYHSKDSCVTPEAFQNPESGTGTFIMKLNLSVGKIIYSARLGGTNGSSFVSSILVDKKQNVYIAGNTESIDFPTTDNAFQKEFIKTADFQNHGFITKLDSTGKSLIFSTFLQGSNNESVSDIAVDSNGNLLVTGATKSKDFPITEDAYQKTHTAFDYIAYISKLDETGSKLLYSSFIGGSGSSGDSVEIDKKGNVYLAGITYYEDFPVTKNAYQTKFGGGNDNTFVLKFDGSLKNLQYSTLLGGRHSNPVRDMAVDFEGNVVITGDTNSRNFPVTKDAIQSKWGGFKIVKTLLSDDFPTDAFMSVIDKTGFELNYSTFLGGSDQDFGNGIAVDSKGNIYVVGAANTKKFPLINSLFQRNNRTSYGDGFLAKFTKIN